MKKEVIYASTTGNTKLLAETIYHTLQGEKELLPFHKDVKIDADILYIGYWVFEGTACKPIHDFLKTLHHQKILLFGTMGAAENEAYQKMIMKNVEKNIASDNDIMGHFLCQGKLASNMQAIYEEKLKRNPDDIHTQKQLENFVASQAHPSKEDLENVKNWVLKYDKI